MKKQYFLLLDTETNNNSRVTDFGALLVDRKGEIIKECAVLLSEQWYSENPLYIGEGDFSPQKVEQKRKEYRVKVLMGSRLITTVQKLNVWLDRINDTYSPTLTAYNLKFDSKVCANSGIDLGQFHKQFCLWEKAMGTIAHRNNPQFRKFVLENCYWGNKTRFGHTVILTKAEVLAHFVTGEKRIEPHTAYEDAKEFELPIFRAVINKRGEPIKHNWKNYNPADWFRA